MNKRRDFLKNSTAFFLGSMLLPDLYARSGLYSGSHIDHVGLQLFSIPRLLEKDFAGTMKMLSRIGYKEIEFYGPYPFSATGDKESWQAVTPSLGFSGSGYYGLNAREVRKILDDNGLSSPSMHTGLFTLREKMGAMAEAAQVLGQTYVILPSAKTETDLEGYKRLAGQFNEIGASAKKYGLRFAYHNHGNGLKAMDGIIPFNLIVEQTDPELVYLQMDIYWTTAGGIDPVTYLDKYPGRFKLMHVKDATKQVRFSGDGGDSKQWIELFPYMTDACSGVLDLKKILSHAKKSGVEHFLVERDLAANPAEALRKGYECLTQLELDS